MTDAQTEGVVRPPWFANKQVQIVVYRINRRPRPKGENLFAERPESFLDHVAESLLFGSEVTTTGRGKVRHWKLGNRLIPEDEACVAGWVGYRTDDMEEVDDYDEENADWKLTVVQRERRASAPFVIVGETRRLYIAKHPTFAVGTLPVVFETTLNEGEKARPEGETTEWAVEPVLDEPDFQQWLEDTAVLDKVQFHVRLPNPDAEESFVEIDQHLRRMEAASLDHALTPRDPDRGLSKDFASDPISVGLMEMVRRAFGRIVARGRGSHGETRRYNQTTRVRRDHTELPADPESARSALVDHALSDAAGFD